MRKQNAVLLGIVSIVLLAASIPLVWMTIHNAKLDFPAPGFFPSGFPGLSLNLTGLNGSILETPIWLMLSVGIIGAGVATLNIAGVLQLSRWAAVVPLGLVGAYVLVGLIVGLANDATLGIGTFTALGGAAAGFVVAIRDVEPDPHRAMLSAV